MCSYTGIHMGLAHLSMIKQAPICNEFQKSTATCCSKQHLKQVMSEVKYLFQVAK